MSENNENSISGLNYTQEFLKKYNIPSTGGTKKKKRN